MTRRRDVANAVLGNGSLLVTLSARGEVEAAWWPHVDRDQHLEELRLGVVVDDRTCWLDTDADGWEQRYEPDASILVTTCTVGGMAVTVTDLVAAEQPVLVRTVRAAVPVRVVVAIRPAIGGTTRHGGAYVDPRTGALVAHRRDQVLALAADTLAIAGVGEQQRHSDVEAALDTGAAPAMTIAHGAVEGGLATTVAREETTVALAFGTTHEDAVGLAVEAAADADGLAAARRTSDAERLGRGAACDVERAAGLYRRSQLVFDLVTDRATGGVIAGPEVDVDFVRSGGYGFVWGRDVAFTSLAFVAAGRADLAGAALRWLARHQGPDGLWLQRQWTDGTLAPSWGTQLDETGAAVLAFDVAYGVLGDGDLDAELWPAARRAGDALVRTIAADNDLPVPSMDPWEERYGQHTYTAACHVAGLRAAARMADRHEPGRAAGYRAAADRVHAAIEAHLWSEEHGRYLRGINVARDDDAGAPVPGCFAEVPPHPGPAARSVDLVDAVPDVSLLGLAWPLGVVAADAPRMKATHEAVVAATRRADGGLMRYPGDGYLGGNPWILTTLWGGLFRRAAGHPEDLDVALDHALARTTSTGLLPEQVDVDSGEAVWVVPLTWSHAMAVLACRPDPTGPHG